MRLAPAWSDFASGVNLSGTATLAAISVHAFAIRSKRILSSHFRTSAKWNGDL